MTKNYSINLRMKTMTDNKLNNWLKYMAWGSVIAASLAGLVGGGFLLGNYLDLLWGTDPVLKIVLMLAGVVLGMAYLITSLSKFGKANDKE